MSGQVQIEFDLGLPSVTPEPLLFHGLATACRDCRKPMLTGVAGGIKLGGWCWIQCRKCNDKQFGRTPQ